MRGGHPHLLFSLFRAAAEGLWIFASAGFLVHVTTGRPFPFAAGAAAFFFAAAVVRASRGRGWRRVALLAVHVAGLTACLAWGLHRGAAGGWVPPGGDWRGWGWFVQSAFWLGLLWVKGAAFAGNHGTHERVCSQFDKGVAAFGLILLTGLVLQVKWGYPAEWGPALPLFFLFFVLSVAAMGTAAPPETEGAPTEAFPAIGPLTALAFPMLIWAVGAGAVLLFMPLLTAGAELGKQALETTTSPVGPVLVRLLRFLLAHRRAPRLREAPSEAGGSDLQPGAADMEVTLLDRIFGWGLTGLLGAVLAALAAAVLFLGLKALLARTRRTRNLPRTRGSILDLLRGWLDRVRRFSPAGLLRGLRDPGPVRLFGRLSAWGARSGLPRRAAETPLEYGTRLSGRFEHLSGDILLIVDLVNRELYANVQPGADHRKSGLRAWRRLRSPRQWSHRIRTLLYPSGPLSVPRS
jgi:hypothetical protein